MTATQLLVCRLQREATPLIAGGGDNAWHGRSEEAHDQFHCSKDIKGSPKGLDKQLWNRLLQKDVCWCLGSRKICRLIRTSVSTADLQVEKVERSMRLKQGETWCLAQQVAQAQEAQMVNPKTMAYSDRRYHDV